MSTTTSTNCFDAAPEFIDEDNRRFRPENPISKKLQFARHSALLPESLIRGKTILDLGCCLGATGHWCLSNGAKHYTGVEVQPAYAETAQRLLGKYHPGKFTVAAMAIEKWLAEQPKEPTYDIVCLLGVIYVFTDYFSILRSISIITKETFAIDGVHINTPYLGLMTQFPEFCGVAFINEQKINMATENSSMHGRGARISPKGVEWVMEELGFKSKEGVIFPAPVTDVADVYNRPLAQLKAGVPVRFLIRFERQQEPLRNRSLSEDLQRGDGIVRPW